MNLYIRAAFAVSAVIAASAFAYYLVVIIPSQEQARIRSVGALAAQEQENIYRAECWKKMEDDLNSYDDLPPSLVKAALARNGYVGEDGLLIDDEVWVARCIEKKKQN